MSTTSERDSAVVLGHRPGIDGLRAIAVTAVVAFHLWPRWIPGGFLGVSLFFTLSGYLITSLLLTEHQRSGTIGLRNFLSRRFRRLAPLSLLVLAVVAAWALLTGAPASNGGAILSSEFYVNNWWMLLRGDSYGDLFANPSPLEHFWSLAIEEQFYLVFPLIAMVSLRRSTATLRTVVVVLLAASCALAASGLLSPDTTYLSTLTRAGEILAGSLLAILWRPGRPRRPKRRRRPDLSAPTQIRWMGPAAIGVLVIGSLTLRVGDVFISRGGLTLLAAVWCAAIMWVVTAGPSNVLCSSAMVWVGRRSYAIYLIHWPVIVWWRAPALLQLGLTVALAALVTEVIENPIRRRRVLVGRAGVLSGLGVMVIVAVGGTVVALRPAPVIEAVAANVAAVAPASGPSSTTTDQADPDASTAATPSTVPPTPVIWWVGDSQADGMLDYLTGRRDPEADPDSPRDTEPTATRVEFMGATVVVVDLAIPGCDGAFGLAGFEPSPHDPTTTTCTDWSGRWQEALGAFGPPSAVVWIMGATTFVQPWTFDDGSRHYPVDDEWQSRWRTSIEQRLDWLDGHLPDTTRILWTEPITPARDRLAALAAPSDAEWARTVLSADTVIQIQRELAAGRPRVTVTRMDAPPDEGGAGIELTRDSYDGIHLTRAAAAQSGLPWLFAQIAALDDAADGLPR